MIRYIILALLSLIGISFSAELILRITELEARLVYRIAPQVGNEARFQDGREILIPSPTPGLLYENRRNLVDVCIGCSANRSNPSEEVWVETNVFGFRGPNNEDQISEQDFRILVIGGELTLGLSVESGQTYPKVLERMLRESSQTEKRIVVSNAGVEGYTLSQKIILAERLLPQVSGIDLLIFEDHKKGRRSFLAKEKSPGKYFEADASLWKENLPTLFMYSGMDKELHSKLLRLASYRFLAAIVNRLHLAGYFRDCPEERLWNCFGSEEPEIFQITADAIAEEKFERFAKSVAIPIIRFDPFRKKYCPSENYPAKGKVFFLSLCDLIVSSVYTDEKPGVVVHQDLARRLEPVVSLQMSKSLK